MQDTPDKVSAESLSHVGRLVELGLRTDAFVDVSSEFEEDTNLPTNNVPSVEEEQRMSKAILAMVGLGVVGVLLALAEREVRS